MSETQLANAETARTETGEIKDQSPVVVEPKEPSTTITPTETKTPETKSSTDPKTGETLLDDDKKPETKPAGAPEAYTDFTLPEGVELKPETLTAATELFKASGLSQESAQKMVDFHVAQLKTASEAEAKAYSDMRADWQTKSKADPDIGPKLEAIKQNVGKVYTAIGDPKLVSDFKEAMNLTGLGDHPAFIKFMNKLSEFVVEGKHVSGTNPSVHGQKAPGAASAPSAAQALYPTLNSSAR